MDAVLVFGSEDCMSWDQTKKVVDQLRADDDFPVSVELLDPVEHKEEFREYGLVICPSVVYKNEIIAVGPPKLETIRESVLGKNDES